MAGIEEYLEQIITAVYGKDVRQAIHDGIEQCYEDGKVGAVDLVARQEIAELVAPSGEAPSAAEITDARIGVDGTVYTSLGLANRTQFSDIRIMLCANNPYVYNYEDKTLFIPQGFILYNNVSKVFNAQTIYLNEVETTYDAWILRYHNGSTAEESYVYATAWNERTTSKDDRTVGYVYRTISFVNGMKNAYANSFGYVVNGYDGYGKGFIAWNFKTKTLTVSKGGFVVTDRGKFNLAAGTYDFSDVETTYNAYQLVFLTDGTITAIPWTDTPPTNAYLIGSIYSEALSIMGSVNILESKQVVHIFGDSITAGVGCNTPYHMRLAIADNVICYNWGVGSTGYVTTATGSVVAGNGAIGDGANITASGNNSVLDIMTGKTFDACVIFAGTNDWGGNVALDTFRTAVQNVLDLALEQTSNILVITPLKRYYNGKSYTSTNSQGATLADYAGIIKEECESRQIGYFDGFNVPIDPTNANQKARLAPDGLHPNDVGQRMIAGAIRQSFEANCGVL